MLRTSCQTPPLLCDAAWNTPCIVATTSAMSWHPCSLMTASRSTATRANQAARLRRLCLVRPCMISFTVSVEGQQPDRCCGLTPFSRNCTTQSFAVLLGPARQLSAATDVSDPCVRVSAAGLGCRILYTLGEISRSMFDKQMPVHEFCAGSLCWLTCQPAMQTLLQFYHILLEFFSLRSGVDVPIRD